MSLLKRLSNQKIGNYCKALDYNPLLIKWFVQAVGKGTCPDTLLGKGGLEQALNFCYANVYDKLDESAKSIISVLLAARRDLTKTQLQVLTDYEHVKFIRALQENSL